MPSGCYKSNLLIIALVVLTTSLSAQVEKLSPEERNFNKISRVMSKQFDGTPVTGQHKQWKRAQHYLESRLDEDGNVFNNVRANMEAVQQLYIDTLPFLIEGDWSQIGPLTTYGSSFNKEGIGRVNQIAFANAATWYAGTAGGGLWRTDVAGVYVNGGPYPWYPLTDSLPSIAISGITVNPDDEDDVYILTGDGNGRGSFGTRGVQPGIGILHSTNGGASWDTTALTYGMQATEAGFKLVRFPASNDTMLAACTDGLYRTTDGWQINMTNPIVETCFDIEFKPGDPNTVYAACQGALRRSTNAGATFSDITGNLVATNISPASLITRMAIAVSPDDPERLYVIMVQANGGLLSFQVSSDGGDSFIETTTNSNNILSGSDPLTDGTGQGWYDLALWSDPDNANIVIVGGVHLYKSTTGGVLWTEIMNSSNAPPAYTHADIHAIESNPISGDIIVGSDGGLYSSSDGGNGWTNRGRGLGITQYYHFDVYSGFLGLPSFIGGAQDNGSSTGLGFDDPVFEMIGGADGFRSFRGNADGEAIRYISSQNGILKRQQQQQLLGIWVGELITPDSELDSDDKGLGAWDTPYQPSVSNYNELIAGFDNLYYSNTGGFNWVEFNYPAGINYDPSKLITEVAWSKSNGNTLYFFVSDTINKHLYKCESFYDGVSTGELDDASCSIAILDTNTMMPSVSPNDPSGNRSNSLSDIALNPDNNDEVWISFPGYTDSMKVYYNQDMASDSPWINMTFNLPNVPVHCVEYDTDGLFVGTDIGVFYLPHGEAVWIYFSKGLPTVAATEIEIDHTIAGKNVFVSTWGRGIWWSTPPPLTRITRWYVDSSAVGSNNGENWTNAFPDLQTALDTILPGDSIWVAQGTYYPESTSGFNLARDNVFIWGGFNGTEDSVVQRDFINNETILSGDIGVLGDSTDNSYHVFTFGGHNGNVLLDGFHITGGNADSPGEQSNGGGIYYATDILNGKPVISNCQIYNNTTLGGGGYPNHRGHGAGMYIGDFDTGDPEMYIINCIFRNNRSVNDGGGLYIDSYKEIAPLQTGTAVVHLEGCSFKENIGNSRGGGLMIEAVTSSTVKLFIDSTIFESNSLSAFAGDGVAMYCDVNTNGGGNLELEISNSTFKDNDGNANSEGGAVYLYAPDATSESNFINCTFEDHSANIGGAILNYCPGVTTMSTMTFDGCSFRNNSASVGGAILITCAFGGNAQVDLINSTFDTNIVTGSGGAIFFNGNNEGHIVSTIDSCTFTGNTASEGGAIRAYVRRHPSDDSVPGTCSLTIGNSLFSNNTGKGAALDLWSDHSIINTTISETDFIGNASSLQGGAVRYTHTSAVNTSSVNAVYTNCDFVGNTATASNGGALYMSRMDALFTGCTFDQNQARQGGAIYNIASSHVDTFEQSFIDCNFLKNKGADFGGAIFNSHTSPSIMLVNVVSSIFDSNYTTAGSATLGKGGAIYTTGIGRSVQNISNTSFIDNIASIDGGAIYASGVLSSPVDTLFLLVDSCTFTNNDAAATGETVELNGSKIRIVSEWSNCNFYNDEPGVIFQNREVSGSYSRASFRDCYIHQLGSLPSVAPSVLMSKETIDN